MHCKRIAIAGDFSVLITVHTRFAEAGIAVYGYDHHGHGESEPKEARERALVHNFDHLVSCSLVNTLTP